MVQVAEILKDIESLAISQSRGRETIENALLCGFKVEKTGSDTVKLTSFDGTSETVLTDRKWGIVFEGEAIVLPPDILRLLKTLQKDSEIALSSIKPGKFQIRQGKTQKWNLPSATDCNAFISLGARVVNGEEQSICIPIDPEILSEGIKNAYPSSMGDNAALQCMNLIFDVKNRTFTAVATDLKRSTVWQAVNVNYPTLPQDIYSLLLPGKKTLALAKFLKSATGKIDLFFTPSLAVFEAQESHAVFTIRLLSVDQYPPILRLLALPFTDSFSINTKEFLATLKRIKILMPENKLTTGNTIFLNFDQERGTFLIENANDLFVEEVGYKPSENGKSPKTYSVAVNLDFFFGAISILTADEFDLKFNPSIARITAPTLNGETTHLIATVSVSK